MAAKVILDTEDAKMNMTPMIDMTFLLVVFFMITIDLTQKEYVSSTCRSPGRVSRRTPARSTSCGILART